MFINFKKEEHSLEWDQIYADKLDRYAKCVQAVAERITGLDDWPTAKEIVDSLIYDTDSTFMNKHSEEYHSDI
jgi:hypothetical protein